MLYFFLWSVSGAATGAVAGWVARARPGQQVYCEAIVGALAAPATASILCWRLRIDVSHPGLAAGSLWAMATLGAAGGALLFCLARHRFEPQLSAWWHGRRATRTVEQCDSFFEH
ncbi:hypothetical protein [Xylophilus sp.]|uniref:hypothetical protein n=1 Tax=Xylophilus sp. TaxID=2653893 RepID=UPI0013BE2DD1|nr:hypothetical protein [Xylophilus sp.]KAF1047409.1 MAG: hypothetical protein GAK38_01928 [Xylophilus sp.]